MAGPGAGRLEPHSCTKAMVKRYSHLTEAHTAGVVARMNEAIFPNGSTG